MVDRTVFDSVAEKRFASPGIFGLAIGTPALALGLSKVESIA